MPDLKWKFCHDMEYRFAMESKGATLQCFWRCEVKEVDRIWYQVPDLEDMDRAMNYVRTLVRIGELCEASQWNGQRQYMRTLWKMTGASLAPFLMFHLV